MQNNKKYNTRNTLSNKTLEKNNIKLIALDEVFLKIPKWNKYYISNYGRLIHEYNNKLKIVHGSYTNDGYHTYKLSKPARKYRGKKIIDEKTGKPKKNKTKSKTAQNLVGRSFLSNPYPVSDFSFDDLHVHHKDSNRKNNYYKNLMWLCKHKNGRQDHDFIHSLKKVALYHENSDRFYTYKDLEILLNRLDVNILEFIDSIKYGTCITKGKWEVFKINDCYVGIQR